MRFHIQNNPLGKNSDKPEDHFSTQEVMVEWRRDAIFIMKN